MQLIEHAYACFPLAMFHISYSNVEFKVECKLHCNGGWRVKEGYDSDYR